MNKESDTTLSVMDKPFAECASCNHFPAYHDVGKKLACRAWAPDQSTDQTTPTMCQCKGWKTKET